MKTTENAPGDPGNQIGVERAFVQGPFTCIDLYNPATGLGMWSGETLAQVQLRYPGAELVELTPWYQAKEKALCTEPAPITEEQYWDALECLPPQRWKSGQINGISCESFEMSEHTSGNVTTVCVRILGDYYQYQTIAGATLAEHVQRVVDCPTRKAQAAAIERQIAEILGTGKAAQ